MDDTEGVNNLLASLESVVNTLSKDLKNDLLEKPLNETLDDLSRVGEIEHNEAVTELEKAKILNIHSYILVSLLFTNLKLNGVKFVNDISIMQEIKRVKEYMDRVKKAEDALYAREFKDKRKEEESAKTINKYLKSEPAVSKVHFQDRESGKHHRFNDQEGQKSQKSEISAKDNENIKKTLVEKNSKIGKKMMKNGKFKEKNSFGKNKITKPQKDKS